MTSITTKATIVALTATVKLARRLIDLSVPLYNFVYMKPPRGRLLYAVGNWCAGVAMPVAERLESTGNALEYWAASTGARLSIEAAVLERVTGIVV
jgi:hypothetical protein